MRYFIHERLCKDNAQKLNTVQWIASLIALAAAAAAIYVLPSPP
jgi:hypothetical protein